MVNSAVHPNLIDGNWVASNDFSVNANPADQTDIIGKFARADAGQVASAIHAADAAAFAWANVSPQVRSDLLENVAQRLLEECAKLGQLLAREEGKSLAEATGEVIRAAQIFRFFAGEALRITGDSIASVRAGVDVQVNREPVGVVGIITPWNFPIAIPAWKIAPALAFGNTVVFKPADLTPASAHALVEIIHEAGCPSGVMNLIMGRGSLIGDLLVDHPKVAAITFTGSAPVGRTLAVRAATHMKKLQLEMGGKNPMVIMDDADLDTAVNVTLNGAFLSTGQRCTASSRIIVHEAIHDTFVERLSKEMRALKVGNPLDETVDIGPVASEQQLATNLRYIKLAKEEGLDVIGGEKIELDASGFFQAPALFIGSTTDMTTSQEEIFGPCASVIKVKDFEQALAAANDTEFGLSAGICTQGLRHARAFKRGVKAGMVMVNLPTAGVDYHVPFGGTKGSSLGSREQGRYAVEFYTTVKTSYEAD